MLLQLMVLFLENFKLPLLAFFISYCGLVWSLSYIDEDDIPLSSITPALDVSAIVLFSS